MSAFVGASVRHSLPRALGIAVAAVAALGGCSGPGPVPIDVHGDTCSWCRMAISDTGFAAELVRPREEPRLFDDIGCLRDFLRAGGSPEGALLFVSDHRTRAWLPAAQAVYERVDGLATPMSSGLVAWASKGSRAADATVPAGTPVPAEELYRHDSATVPGPVSGGRP